MSVTDQIRRELLGEFRQSARDRLERIAAAWLALESDPASAATEQAPLLLRELHTLKGEAKLMGYGEVCALAHRAEDLVIAARGGGFKRAATLGDLVLGAVDALGKLVSTEAELATPADITELAGRMEAATTALGVAPASAAAAAPPVAERPESAAEGRDGWVRLDVASAHRLAEDAGEQVIAHQRYRRSVRELRGLSDELGGLVAGVARLTGDGAELGALCRRLDGVVEALADDLHEGEVIARALENEARRLRLVPLAPRLRVHLRAVRELARELGKQASVSISDGGVAIDREVVERIGEPLVHLLRNAVDHGLESPAARAAAGKYASGRIMLTAERVGAEVVVIVADDGAGIDIDTIRRRAGELGFHPNPDALDEAEALALLFAPGFSTRRQVSETSGRGVGLDVVKRQIEALGGTVRVSTQRGQGTQFELRVPVTVALTRVLVLEEHGRSFALPHAAVEAVIAVDPAALMLVHQRRTLPFRGGRVPVVELAAALQLPLHQISEGNARAVVVRHEEQRVALLVDRWRGDAEVVTKPLGPLTASRLAIGACTLDGGDLALLLNPAELIARALGEVPRIRLAARAPSTPADRRILLVEDSAITRTMIAQLLRMLGYQVVEAEDGARALRTLDESPPDLVITDLEMPEVDGIELIRSLRAEARWKSLPILVLSTRGSAADKQRAVSAGADAYLVKTEFSEAALREALDRHLRPT